MKNTALIFAFMTFGSVAFSQVAVDCKISSTYEVSATYDYAKSTLQVTKHENGETANFQGVSFAQLNKTGLNKDQTLLSLASATGISVTAANAANVFVIQKSATDLSELVDYIDVDGESLGVAAVIGPKTQKCQ